MKRIIAHVDMDAFFAAIEERDHIWLAGKPVVIGADPEGGTGRGVVSTANYMARAYGIRSAMPIQQAWKCSIWAKKQQKPSVFFITPNSKKYRQVSQEIFSILSQYGPVEKTSVDEAYIDLSQSRSYKQAKEKAKRIKQHIKKETKLTASIGIGPNKLIAKIASDQNKPNGLVSITPSRVQSFLYPLPVKVLPGVGPQTLRVLHKRGIHCVEDLAQESHHALVTTFGAWGNELYHKAYGAGDEHIISEPAKPQSIGEQETYQSDTLEPQVIFSSILSIAGRIMEEVKRKQIFAFRQVSVMVRFTDFQTKSRHHTLPAYVCKKEEIFKEASRLILPFLDGRENKTCKPIRLVGVRIEQLI